MYTLYNNIYTALLHLDHSAYQKRNARSEIRRIMSDVFGRSFGVQGTGGTGDADFVIKLGKVGCVSHMYRYSISLRT